MGKVLQFATAVLQELSHSEYWLLLNARSLTTSPHEPFLCILSLLFMRSAAWQHSIWENSNGADAVILRPSQYLMIPLSLAMDFVSLQPHFVSKKLCTAGIQMHLSGSALVVEVEVVVRGMVEVLEKA